MKITVDTNVLVSATFWYGGSNEIIEMAERGEIELILSKDIVKEFTRVLGSDELQKKIRDKNLEMIRTISKLVAIATMVESRVKICAVTDDPDDDQILECAKAGKVDFIVSNDAHLLKLKEFEGILIVSSQKFLQEIAKK